MFSAEHGISNVRAELVGVIAALALAAKRGATSTKIMCDCKIIVDGASGVVRRLTNLDLWRVFDVCLEQAHIPVSAISWVPSHSGVVGNELADLAARTEARLIRERARQSSNHTRVDGCAEVPPTKRQRYDPALDGWEE